MLLWSRVPHASGVEVWQASLGIVATVLCGGKAGVALEETGEVGDGVAPEEVHDVGHGEVCREQRAACLGHEAAVVNVDGRYGEGFGIFLGGDVLGVKAHHEGVEAFEEGTLPLAELAVFDAETAC